MQLTIDNNIGYNLRNSLNDESNWNNRIIEVTKS